MDGFAVKLHVQVLNGSTQILGQFDGIGQRGVHPQQHKFFSPIPGDHIFTAQFLGPQQLPDSTQAFITRRVAVGVIDCFEVIDVKHNHSQ